MTALDGAAHRPQRAAAWTPPMAATTAPAAPRIALYGTGVVGAAFVARWQALRRRGVPAPALAWLANSRRAIALAAAADAIDALAQARAAPRRTSPESSAGVGADLHAPVLRAGDVVVDATASDAIAAHHVAWLRRGVHVVTANKLGLGADAARAEAIAQALRAGNVRYGDAATVGAGLPLLRTLRALVAGGDRIHAVEGVLSGSLAWLLGGYDGARPFSQRVQAAREAGYTEPDPRVDLSGEDVRRKLAILARAAGFAAVADDIAVEPLLPPHEDGYAALDARLEARWRAAQRDGACLRYVAHVDAAAASIGLRALPATHALCAGRGSDNCVAIHSDRYRTQPLVIQGPGAGAEVTAAALWDDVLAIAEDAAAALA